MINGEEVAKFLRCLKSDGEKQYKSFVEDRLIKCSVPLTNTIKRNTLILPSNRNHNVQYIQTLTLKENQKLVQNLKVAISYRRNKVLEALQYEPKNTPQLFVYDGKLYQSPKATILSKFKDWSKYDYNVVSADESTLSQLVVDLSMVVITLQYKAKSAKSVREFYDMVWNYIRNIGNFSRIDIVADNYEDKHPLKGHTRLKRGSGTTTVISLDGPIPARFSEDFMLFEANKNNFYKLMADYFLTKSMGDPCIFVFTKVKETFSNYSDSINMSESSHLEADYRIVVHILDGIEHGYKRCVVRANDVDVVFILLGYMSEFLSSEPNFRLVIDFGVGRNQAVIDMNLLSEYISILVWTDAVDFCSSIRSVAVITPVVFLELEN